MIYYFCWIDCMKMELCHHVSLTLQAALKLSSDQKRDFIKARQNLIARNEEIKKKRRRIVSNLEVEILLTRFVKASTEGQIEACFPSSFSQWRVVSGFLLE